MFIVRFLLLSFFSVFFFVCFHHRRVLRSCRRREASTPNLSRYSFVSSNRGSFTASFKRQLSSESPKPNLPSNIISAKIA